MLVGFVSTLAQTMGTDLITQCRMVLTSSLVRDFKEALRTSSPRELCLQLLGRIRRCLDACLAQETRRLLVKIAMIITSLYLAWKGGKLIACAPLARFNGLSAIQALEVEYTRRVEQPDVTAYSREVLQAFDAVEEEQGEEVEGAPLTRNVYVAEAAMIAKGVFGTPQRSSANDQAIRTFLRRLFRDTDHRRTHVARDITLAIELVYTHTLSELAAARFRNSSTRKARELSLEAGAPIPLVR